MVVCPAPLTLAVKWYVPAISVMSANEEIGWGCAFIDIGKVISTVISTAQRIRNRKGLLLVKVCLFISCVWLEMQRY